jgi:hypothetical protein
MSVVIEVKSGSGDGVVEVKARKCRRQMQIANRRFDIGDSFDYGKLWLECWERSYMLRPYAPWSQDSQTLKLKTRITLSHYA